MPTGWNYMYALWKGHLSQSSKVSWRPSVHLQSKKPPFHEVRVHTAPDSGSPPPLESKTQPWRPFAILPEAHTRHLAQVAQLTAHHSQCRALCRNVLPMVGMCFSCRKPSVFCAPLQHKTPTIGVIHGQLHWSSVVIGPHRLHWPVLRLCRLGIFSLWKKNYVILS